MSSYGVGQGLDRGVRMAADFILKGLEMKQKDAHFQQAMDYNLEWDRGDQGLPPSYVDEEAAQQAAATRPAIPSSTPIETPGPLGIPRTRFSTGRPIQPIPQTAPASTAGAMGLIPPRRPPRFMPRLRRGY